MIGPSKLSSIICRWDDEPYFILIQVFIVVIQGKDHLPVTQRGHLSLSLQTVYVCVCIASYRSECPGCDVCLTSTLPCWRRPVHIPVTWLSSSPRAPHRGRTRIHIPPTLKAVTADTCGEQGCGLPTTLTTHGDNQACSLKDIQCSSAGMILGDP